MLGMWCRGIGMTSESQQMMEKTIAIDSDHRGARTVLGYRQVDGRWVHRDRPRIPSEPAPEDEEQEPAQQATSQQTARPEPEPEPQPSPSPDRRESPEQRPGMVQHRGQWISEDEYYQQRGYVRHLGRWISPAAKRRLDQRLERFRQMTRMRADWDQAFEFETRHFAIKTNTSHQVAREIGIAMDLCVDRLQQVFGLARLRTRIPLEVFATQDQFMRYSAQAGIPVGPGTLGYYYWGRGQGVRAFYAGSVERTLSTLFHETSHLILHNTVQAGRRSHIPTWSDEGPAVMFEDAIRRPDHIDIHAIPWARLWQLQGMLNSQSLSLNHLVTRQGAMAYPVQYYPQGWGLMYYLLYAHDGRYQRHLDRYFRELTRRRGVQDNLAFFREIFGFEPNSINEEWKQYMLAIEPRTADDFIGATEAALGSFFNLANARRFAARALALAPDDWRAHQAQARALLVQGLMSRDEQRRAACRDAMASFAKALDMSGYADIDGLRRLAQRRDRSILHELALHRDHGRAALYAGEYEQAIDIFEGVLSIDELSSDAYKYLALLFATATVNNFRDLDEAKRLLAIADDLGKNHENLYVAAMIAVAENRRSQAVELLNQAAGEDRFGFGAQYYRHLIAQMQQR